MNDERKKLYSLLGKLPERNRPIKVQLISKEETDDLIIERLMLDINGLELVPAYFTKPKNSSGKLPVVLFDHSHFGQYEVGKDEYLFGRKEMQSPPYAIALARKGYAGLCIDSWAFGKRAGRSEQDIFKDMLWKGQVMWGMMVYDNLRALDYLESREDVDMKRVATMGMSMGSTMAWWLAAIDERVKVTVDICCLTDFDTLLSKKGLSGHGVYYYVPGLLKHFTTSQINALIAPRAHLGLAGLQDKLTPVEGLDIIDRELTRVYEEQGHPERWKLLRYDVAHVETPEGRQEIIAFLKRSL